ncbi:MAG TPA: hypothetical protein PLH57_02030 [Oligoflexia bacterium]|nr:hypothetical protein [Oligoflexia bacterium]
MSNGIKRRINLQGGFTALQSIIIAAAVALAVASGGQVVLQQIRQQKSENLKIGQKAVAERVRHYISSPEGLRVTSNKLWDILSFNTPSARATRTLKGCLTDDGGTLDCLELAPNEWVTHLYVLNPLHELVHPLSGRTIMRQIGEYQFWKIDGTPCLDATGATRNCPIASRVLFRPVCHTENDSLFSCEVATHLVFRYEVTNPISPHTGDANGFRTAPISAEFVLTTEEINYVTPPTNPGCDTANGYVPTGITANGNFICGRPPVNTNLIARHYISGTQAAPGCTFKNVVRPDGSRYNVSFKNVDSSLPARVTLPYAGNPTTRRSFAGLWGTYSFGTQIDLGGHGSCINNSRFAAGFYTECSRSGSCQSPTLYDRTMWLRDVDRRLPESATINEATIPNLQTVLSECAVCEIEGHISVVHNFNKTDHRHLAPQCPAGYDRLYEGRSVAAFSGAGRGNFQGYTVRHDLSSISSCHPYNAETVPFVDWLTDSQAESWKLYTHGRMPFIEHYSSSNTFGHLSIAQYTAYFGRQIEQTTNNWTTRTTAPFKCSVCWKPPGVSENILSTNIGN